MAPLAAMRNYLAYGLELSSQIALPELVPGGDGRDVSIRFGNVQAPLGSEDVPYGFIGGSADALYYRWPEVGLLVARGQEIIVDLIPDYDDDYLHVVLLGAALCGLLFQRGFYILHAGSVQIGSAAVAIAAFSGAGKSTVVGALLARGHSLIADDMTAIHPESAMVAPGYPQQRLWPDTALALGHEADTLPRLHPATDKLWHWFGGQLAESSLPLRRVYLLEDGPDLDLTPVPPAAAAFEFVRYTGVIRALAAGDNQRRHFERCVALAQCVAVYRLIRPRRLDILPDLAQLIEMDIGSTAADPAGTTTPSRP